MCTRSHLSHLLRINQGWHLNSKWLLLVVPPASRLPSCIPCHSVCIQRVQLSSACVSFMCQALVRGPICVNTSLTYVMCVINDYSFSGLCYFLTTQFYKEASPAIRDLNSVHQSLRILASLAYVGSVTWRREPTGMTSAASCFLYDAWHLSWGEALL